MVQLGDPSTNTAAMLVEIEQLGDPSIHTEVVLGKVVQLGDLFTHTAVVLGGGGWCSWAIRLHVSQRWSGGWYS